MSELTAKQKAFIEELPKNQWNGTKAAIAAGYSEKSAGVMAHRLLKNPKIAEELERRTAEIAEKTDVEVAEIIGALRKFAFGGKKATNTEQLKALDLLGRYKAMFTDRLQTEQTEQQRELTATKAREARRIAEIRVREVMQGDVGLPPTEIGQQARRIAEVIVREDLEMNAGQVAPPSQ